MRINRVALREIGGVVLLAIGVIGALIALYALLMAGYWVAALLVASVIAARLGWAMASYDPAAIEARRGPDQV